MRAATRVLSLSLLVAGACARAPAAVPAQAERPSAIEAVRIRELETPQYDDGRIDATLRARIQMRLDSFHRAGSFPGATLAISLADGRTVGFATGVADTARRQPMPVSARMPQGSVGKTYYAALAWRLIHSGRLDPDALASRYLGHEPWWRRIPNADSIRIRDLLRHTSGVMRYEFKESFLRDLRREPYAKRDPLSLLEYVYDEKAPFPAGAGWEYSDTNYFLLGLIIERLEGLPLQTLVDARLLQERALRNTVANRGPAIPGVVQGYAGPDNPFGGSDAIIGADGRFTFDPSFEWAGGGYSSTAADLARWAQNLYSGRVVDSSLVRRAVDAAVPAPGLGRNARYGWGVIVRDSVADGAALGAVYGHSGFFPGYQTDMRWYRKPGVAVVVMVNSSAARIFAPRNFPGIVADDVARLVAESGEGR